MGRINRIEAMIILFLAASLGTSWAQEKTKREYQFEGSNIEGEREKPRDLYILPWQGTSPLTDSKLQIEFLNGFEEIKDREDLKQEIQYYQRVGEKAE